MRTSSYLSFAILMLAAGPLFAQQQPAKPATPTQSAKPAQPAGAAPAAATHDNPAAGVVASVSAVATVEAIDLKTREVTLKKENGELVTLVVSEEARNLPQVVKGDIVTVNYEVGLVVALGPPGKEPQRVEDTQVARAPAGAKPAGAIQQTVAVTATVVAIDAATHTVTLKGPRQTVALPVSKDIDLSKVKVGDQVGAIYQESLALTVEPVKKK
jgi:Cu/Ag efflux protein CusF